jgi:undecaprenyl-diphosphatase
VVEHRLGVLDPLFQGLSYVGSFGLVWLALAVVVSGLSWRRPWLAVRVAVAVLVAEMASGLLKLWVERDRPPLANPEPRTLVDLPTTHSFPSGHATVAFACATVLALAVPRLAVPLYALAALIAWSRVYVGVHYPFDVVAGAVLGVALGFAVRFSGRALRRVAVGKPADGAG